MTTVISETIQELIENSAINSIAIIDDAFDAPHVAHDDLEIFWNEIEGEEAALAELAELIGEIKDFSDLTEDKILAIWRNKNSLVKSRRFLLHLFPNAINNYLSVEPIYTKLDSLNLTLSEHGAHATAQDIGSPEIVFIDHMLGEDNGVERSKNLVKGILKIVSETPNFTPIIVLMSADDKIDEKADQFREETDLIGGLFYVFSKETLSKDDVLEGFIGSWCTNYSQRGALQTFISTVCEAFKEQFQCVKNDIYALKFEDYADIQSGYLETDGHPLGDYFLSFFMEHFDTLLRQDPSLKRVKQEVDLLSFQRVVARYEKPSNVINSFYRNYTYYQADLYNDESANPDEYQLQTGDIFVKENKNVYVICNAECDLAFNSQTGRKRKDDLPILFVPGDLKLYQGVPQSPLGFINIDNEDYSVFLNENLTFSMPYSEVSDWANKCNCQRKFRLKTKHALNLQKSVSEQIFRIGSHKTPPIYRTVSLELYHREKIGSHLFVKSRLPKPISGSSVTSGKKMDRYDLNIAFPNILDISAAMAKHANELVQTAIEIYKTEDKPKWYKQRMDLYESVSDNFKNLYKYFFNTSFKASGDKIDELVTTVCYNEFEPKSINGNHMFVLLIKNND